MDGVPNPIVGGGSRARFIEYFLIRNHCRVVLLCKLGYEVLTLLNSGTPLHPIVDVRVNLKSKRLAEHQADMGQSGDGIG
jgi:hypothetical protein